MQLKEMSVLDVIKRGIKKTITELTSVKFWGACFIGYLNYDIITKKSAFDSFGILAFLLLLGIREAADLMGKKG